MKRVGLWAVGIGVLVSVELITVAQGYAGGNDGAPKCTLATLKGRYLFAAPATLFWADRAGGRQRRRISCF